MALEDRDIFRAICERFTDQPIEFVMAQYAKAKRMNMEIERLTSWDIDESDECDVEDAVTEREPEDTAPPAKKKLTRRSFKVKPENSITDNVIYCCICGEERQSLTSKHLAKHDVTVEEYKKACGFAPDQPLMSGRRLARSRDIITRAQQARIAKRAEADRD